MTKPYQSLPAKRIIDRNDPTAMSEKFVETLFYIDKELVLISCEEIGEVLSDSPYPCEEIVSVKLSLKLVSAFVSCLKSILIRNFMDFGELIFAIDRSECISPE